MINLKDIEYQINKKIILQKINLIIHKNKTTVIMGKNGSGKSTLLKLLNQIIKPTSGSLASVLKSPVPMLFQKPLLLKNTVKYNYQILQKIKKNKINHNWFKKFQLSSIKNQNVSTLSGGEKQKLFLARTMSFEQEYLFLDEPNQNLDLESENLLVELLIHEKQKKTIVMTQHDFQITKKLADYVIYLDKGQILFNESKNNFFKKFN